MIVSFLKYEVLGNDFILIDDRSNVFPISKELIVKLCHRNFGIGADGIVFLKKSTTSDFRMAIYNSDGLEANMCGNGLCCFIRFLKDLGYKNKIYNIETKAYKTVGGFIGEKIYFLSPKPRLLKKAHEVKINNQDIYVDYIDSGVHHLIHYVEDLKKIDVENLGRDLRYFKDFQPIGANVNFVKMLNDNQAEVRVYEKGVEKETLACTTGAIAVAFSIKERKKNQGPIEISFQKGKIEVFFENEETKIINRANLSFSGTVNIKNFIQS